MLRVIGDELSASEPLIRLPSLTGDGSAIEEITSADELIFLIPGIEGIYIFLNFLAVTIPHFYNAKLPYNNRGVFNIK